MTTRASSWCVHTALLLLAAPTLLPFVFVLNNSVRTTTEMYHGYFSPPRALTELVRCGWHALTGAEGSVRIKTGARGVLTLSYADACAWHWHAMLKNYTHAWSLLRPFMLNTMFVVLCIAVGVLLTGTVAAFVLSRFSFPGRREIGRASCRERV